MSTPEFVIQIVQAVAWPAAVCIIVWYLANLGQKGKNDEL